MQNAYDKNAIRLLAVKNHVTTIFQTMQPGADFLAWSPKNRVMNQPRDAFFHFAHVTLRLRLTPVANGIHRYIE